jgi:hypothetical protein
MIKIIIDYIINYLVYFFKNMFSNFRIELNANQKETIERGRRKADYITRYFH